MQGAGNRPWSMPHGIHALLSRRWRPPLPPAQPFAPNTLRVPVKGTMPSASPAAQVETQVHTPGQLTVRGTDSRLARQWHAAAQDWMLSSHAVPFRCSARGHLYCSCKLPRHAKRVPLGSPTGVDEDAQLWRLLHQVPVQRQLALQLVVGGVLQTNGK